MRSSEGVVACGIYRCFMERCEGRRMQGEPSDLTFEMGCQRPGRRVAMDGSTITKSKRDQKAGFSVVEGDLS